MNITINGVTYHVDNDLELFALLWAVLNERYSSVAGAILYSYTRH